MRTAEWIATQPFKATGTYGLYQDGKESFSRYGHPEAGGSLLLSGFIGAVAPLTSRGLTAGTLEGNELKIGGGIFLGAPLDALGWYGTLQLVPQIEHNLPQTEHMLGGLVPFLIARAGINLASHLTADIAGLPFRQRRKTGRS